MGLSIHYSGALKERDCLPALTEEIRDICSALDWDFTIIHNKEIQGIVFSPDECEPLFFTFDKDGKLINPIYLQYEIDPNTVVSVKTQFAGIHTHIAVIKLLKHISEKYFASFHLMDEGNYWETGDEKILQGRFNDYGVAFDLLANALSNMEHRQGETPESLIERMIACINMQKQKDG